MQGTKIDRPVSALTVISLLWVIIEGCIMWNPAYEANTVRLVVSGLVFLGFMMLHWGVESYYLRKWIAICNKLIPEVSLWF